MTVDYLRRHLARLDEERRNHGHLMRHPDERPVHPQTTTDRIGHANMAYTSTGLDRAAAEKVADVIFNRGGRPPATVDG